MSGVGGCGCVGGVGVWWVMGSGWCVVGGAGWVVSRPKKILARRPGGWGVRAQLRRL